MTNLTGGGGGGGGGALLIASSTRIVLTGGILARGGNGGRPLEISSFVGAGQGGNGSGGAVRLVANRVDGSGGSIDVSGGTTSGFLGGQGRIRVEAFTSALVATLSAPPSSTNPSTPFLTNPPLLQIASVGGMSPPTAPTGSFSAPDVILPATTANPVPVTITASQIPLGTPVQVTVIPAAGTPTTVTSPGLTGTSTSATTSVSVTIPTDQPVVLQATATFTLAALPGAGPVFAQGEEVERVKVAAVMGGASEVTYITKSGREVSANVRVGYR